MSNEIAGYIVSDRSDVIDAIGDTPEEARAEYMKLGPFFDYHGEPLEIPEAADLLRAPVDGTHLYMRPATARLMAKVREEGGAIAWKDGATRHEPSDVAAD